MLEGQVYGERARGTGSWGRGVRQTGSWGWRWGGGGGGLEVAKEGIRKVR